MDTMSQPRSIEKVKCNGRWMYLKKSGPADDTTFVLYEDDLTLPELRWVLQDLEQTQHQKTVTGSH